MHYFALLILVISSSLVQGKDYCFGSKDCPESDRNFCCHFRFRVIGEGRKYNYLDCVERCNIKEFNYIYTGNDVCVADCFFKLVCAYSYLVNMEDFLNRPIILPSVYPGEITYRKAFGQCTKRIKR